MVDRLLELKGIGASLLLGACAHAQSKSHTLKTHIYVWSKTEEDRAQHIGVAKHALEEFTDISKVLQPSPIVPNWHSVVTSAGPSDSTSSSFCLAFCLSFVGAGMCWLHSTDPGIKY